MSEQLYQRCAHHGNPHMESMHGCDGYYPVNGPVYQQVKGYKLMTLDAAQALELLLKENVLEPKHLDDYGEMRNQDGKGALYDMEDDNE